MNAKSNSLCGWVAGLVLLTCQKSLAGMPSFNLNEVVRLRMEDISFFILLLVLTSAGMKLLWNFTFKQLPKVPRLTYGRALGLTTLLGLMLLLVLSMISGARELLTPGAWRKQGISYRLNTISDDATRQRRIEFLRNALLEYADSHKGKFPPHDWIHEIPERLWQADEQGTRFIYSRPEPDATNALMTCEPMNFGDQRYAAYANGEIRKISSEEIRRSLGIK
jgi:hypothetical protein